LGLLKRKEEKTAIISIRVPASLKVELSELRQVADKNGFDVTASLSEAVMGWAKKIREELGLSAKHANGKPREAFMQTGER